MKNLVLLTVMSTLVLGFSGSAFAQTPVSSSSSQDVPAAAKENPQDKKLVKPGAHSEVRKAKKVEHRDEVKTEKKIEKKSEKKSASAPVAPTAPAEPVQPSGN